FDFTAPADQKKTTEVTLSVHDRVNVLKRQIAEQILEKQRKSKLQFLRQEPINSKSDEYTYVDIEKLPITPINDNDIRKKKDRFKLREIVTTRKPQSVETPKIFRSITNTVKIKQHVVKPIDSFYRRILGDMNSPIEWLHCQDLITPFITGYKTDLTFTKRLTTEDHSVTRLLQLLSMNTTGHTKEEIYSILYQISNIQIRLFQWDVGSIAALLSVIVKDKPHTFKNIIHGVRALLASWHLDIGNTTNLLKQAKIFRPPCIKVSEYGGSTKTSRAIRYAKLTTPRTTCSETSDKNC
ncbi:uncharacterized protein LOC114358371, partial [Ostrinia furnacalis]|uniref:uncharacterized protein LOC114358371 n=1 Tax=Ostrinia furnacalis TaxID=93504 RepID=UPI001038A5BF